MAVVSTWIVRTVKLDFFFCVCVCGQKLVTPLPMVFQAINVAIAFINVAIAFCYKCSNSILCIFFSSLEILWFSESF